MEKIDLLMFTKKIGGMIVDAKIDVSDVKDELEGLNMRLGAQRLKTLLLDKLYEAEELK